MTKEQFDKVIALMKAGWTRGALKRELPGAAAPCYCLEGALCEVYHEETGRGKWVESDWNLEATAGARRFETTEHEDWGTLPPVVRRYFNLPHVGAYAVNDTKNNAAEVIDWFKEAMEHKLT